MFTAFVDAGGTTFDTSNLYHGGEAEALLGPRSPDHLAAYLTALDIELGPEHHQQLEAAGTPQLGTPHDDVAAALESGVDGDRALLRSAPSPVL